MKKPIEIVHEKQEFIKEWKTRLQEAQKIAPIIDCIEEVTNWEEKALNNLPFEAEEIPTKKLTNDLQVEYTYLTKSIPLPPKVNYEFTFQNNQGGTITSSSSTFEVVSRIGDIGTQNCIDYSKMYTNLYYEIQQSQNRVEEVRELILKFNSENLTQRFDECKISISKFHIYIEQKESVANFIRNLVNGIKGELFKKARNFAKENMTWETMANRLSINGYSKNLIIRQEIEQSNLLTRTADVLKDRSQTSVTNIDFIWTHTIDHLYIVLSNIRFV